MPGLKLRRGVTADDDAPPVLSSDLAGRVDERFAEQQRGSWRRDNRVNQIVGIAVRGGNHRRAIFDRHFVRPWNHSGPAVPGPEGGQVRQCLDERSVVEAIRGIATPQHVGVN